MRGECRRTADVGSATVSGEWPVELLEHVAGCEACQGTRAVIGFLAPLADEARRVPVPAAGIVFLRAQALLRLRRESEALEEARRPLQVAGAAAGATALSGLVIGGGWLAGRPPLGQLPGTSVVLTTLLLTAALLVARWWGADEG